MPESLVRRHAEIEKRRKKAEAELEIVKAEEQLAERLEKAFSNTLEDQTVFPTVAQDGTPRIRAYILDEDAGMGYLENTHWFGIARISETQYAVEAHYPHSSDKLTVFTTFNTDSGILEQYREDNDTRGEKPLAGTLEIDGDYKHRVLRGLYYQLGEASTYEFGAYEHRLQDGDRRYIFELEQLQ